MCGSSRDYKYTMIYKISAPDNNDVYIWYSVRKDRRYFQGMKNLNGRKYIHPRLGNLINNFYVKVERIKSFPCSGLREVQAEIERLLPQYPNNINHLCKIKKLGRKKGQIYHKK